MAVATVTPVYLVDASIYIFRAYFSLPDEWHSPEGWPVNALYGYARFMLTFLQTSKPQQLAVAYDESLGSCFRNELYADYKASRAPPDEALAFQLAACRALTEQLGIHSVAHPHYEADDLIATLGRKARQRGHSLTIVTRDKDLGQLLEHPEDYLWDFAAAKRLYREDFYQHFAVQPEQLIDYLALVGDPVDDIPGVPGIGKKTAAGLLQQFGSINTMYADISAVRHSGLRGARGIADKLEDYRQQIALAQKLVRLECRIPLTGPQTLAWHPPEKHQLREFLDSYGLGQSLQTLLDRCDWWPL